MTALEDIKRDLFSSPVTPVPNATSLADNDENGIMSDEIKASGLQKARKEGASGLVGMGESTKILITEVPDKDTIDPETRPKARSHDDPKLPSLDSTDEYVHADDNDLDIFVDTDIHIVDWRIHTQRAEEIEKLIDQDDLWDTDLEDEAIDDVRTIDMHDTSGRSEYRLSCDKFGVVPVRYFVEHINDPEMVMRYHGLGGQGTKAIAACLRNNITIEHLDLTGNWIDSDGAVGISRMLEDNGFVQDLILRDNRIGDDGVYSIVHGMTINTCIKHLDLSSNHISDASCENLANMIETSKFLTELILSWNSITCDGAKILGAGLGANEVLEQLDLSWNKIRGKGAAALAKGIKENVRLKKCNLSWNGFGAEGGKAIADALKENSTLAELDIAGNRLDTDAFLALGKAIACNEGVQRLKLGFNPTNTDGAIQLAHQINNSHNTTLLEMSLADISVEFEFIKTMEAHQRTVPDFKFEYGVELRVGNTADDMKKNAVDMKSPLVLLKEHILINDYRIIHALSRLDEQCTQTVTAEQFMEALEELKIPYRKTHIEELKSKLDRFGNGTIYYGDFVQPAALERESHID